ncbi:nicotinate (nicotinamide) nucleotide adenylyltransferase [Okeanomitos corallinicola TIOX110]|uniref:Probable nicotinate-nucleotide adenylyltransferase n=1 Tax=Okeanomitos corallinicola TIOX110 TaxID=3133117 RepID=A0ABZ2ULU5_9CYAN
MQQIAIFGGTFDPIHWGHLLIAEAAMAQISMEQLIWVPSINPPHKQATAFEHRLAMLKLATRNNPAFTVSIIEKESVGNSYAINTLINLSALYPNTHWYWIIGLDAFQTLPRWYCGIELAQMCDWLIAPRPAGAETISQSESVCKQVEQKFKEKSNTINWQLLNTPLVRVSSSKIREFCRLGVSIKNLVPESVRLYISTHQLYSDNPE